MHLVARDLHVLAYIISLDDLLMGVNTKTTPLANFTSTYICSTYMYTSTRVTCIMRMTTHLDHRQRVY